MTDTVEAETCSGCGDAVTTVDDEGKGPCCHNLPRRWTRGADGLYNSTEDEDAEVDYEIEDEDEDAPPCCANCESRYFNIIQTQVVGTNFGDGGMLYYRAGDFETRAECVDCGTFPYHLDLEEV